MSLLNDIIMELFEKVRDIYCVLPSILIINKIIELGSNNTLI